MSTRLEMFAKSRSDW